MFGWQPNIVTFKTYFTNAAGRQIARADLKFWQFNISIITYRNLLKDKKKLHSFFRRSNIKARIRIKRGTL